MDTVCTCQGLGIAVLGKQRDRRRGLASQNGFQVFDERKARTLNHCGSIVAAGLRPLNELLDCRLHGAQDQSWRAHAHHFQRTTRLVQLLASDAQWACVQRCKIRLACGFCISHKTAHGLDSAIQRFAQFVKHPRQRTQVLIPLGPIRGRCIVDINR